MNLLFILVALPSLAGVRSSHAAGEVAFESRRIGRAVPHSVILPEGYQSMTTALRFAILFSLMP